MSRKLGKSNLSKVKYRSGLEERLAKALGDKYLYEPYAIPYIVKRKYTPDFVFEKSKVLIEAKGFFRVGDTQKYTSIRDSIKEDGWELVFVFSDPKKKLRKGSKMTLGQWCDKEGFAYFTEESCSDMMEYIQCLQLTKN